MSAKKAAVLLNSRFGFIRGGGERHGTLFAKTYNLSLMGYEPNLPPVYFALFRLGYYEIGIGVNQRYLLFNWIRFTSGVRDYLQLFSGFEIE